MALITEDGTAKADAESYITVADADTYHANRANAAWAALTTPVKEASLRKGTEFMTQLYRQKWKGSRVTATQALDWPRAYVKREDYFRTDSLAPAFLDGEFYYPDNAVPVEIQRACAELALKASTTELAPDIGQRTVREKVDVLEVEYDRYSPQFTQYRAVDNMVSPFLRDVGGLMRRVVRS